MKTETRPLMNAAYHLLLVLALRAGIIFMVELMTYCGAYANDLTKPGLPMKSLVYCSEASPTGFDPNRYIAVSDNAVAATVFNRLLEYKLENTNKIELSLAERWDISPDGRAYTFYLRRGVKFHATPWFKPTRDFNAEDVVFTSNGCLTRICRLARRIRLNFLATLGSLRRSLLKLKRLILILFVSRSIQSMRRFFLHLRYPRHRFYPLNTRSNCWKEASRQRSIRSRLVPARLFSENMIKIQTLCSTAIQNIGSLRMCACPS